MIVAIAVGVVLATMLALLVFVAVQSVGARRQLEDVSRSVGSGAKSAARSIPSSAIEARLSAIEQRLTEIALDARRATPVPRPPMRSAPSPLTDQPTGSIAQGRDPSPTDASASTRQPSGSDASRTRESREGHDRHADEPGGVEDARSSGTVATTPDELADAYRTLIAQPRKGEIARWFEDVGGVGCEIGDDDAFQLVGRGDGARLMLVPMTENTAMVLPSPLMVADFPVSFADVLTARTVVRRGFDLDADGSGALRLVEPAEAVLREGIWRLRKPGRLAGLAKG